MQQHQDFLARKFDILITASSLEDVEGLDHFPICEERFILALPMSYKHSIAQFEDLQHYPFIRYSLTTGVGQRVERQLARMRLRVPNTLEVDSTRQHLAAIADGLGWSITTPMCLASQRSLTDRIRLVPMPRGQFYRTLHVVARSGDLGDLPREIAEFAARFLREESLPQLRNKFPWIEDCLKWPEQSKT